MKHNSKDQKVYFWRIMAPNTTFSLRKVIKLYISEKTTVTKVLLNKFLCINNDE